ETCDVPYGYEAGLYCGGAGYSVNADAYEMKFASSNVDIGIVHDVGGNEVLFLECIGDLDVEIEDGCGFDGCRRIGSGVDVDVDDA
ncbi:hypothetical protein HDU76_007743, partial [Blyttiomyces sp. JEL0837]